MKVNQVEEFSLNIMEIRMKYLILMLMVFTMTGCVGKEKFDKPIIPLDTIEPIQMGVIVNQNHPEACVSVESIDNVLCLLLVKDERIFGEWAEVESGEKLSIIDDINAPVFNLGKHFLSLSYTSSSVFVAETDDKRIPLRIKYDGENELLLVTIGDKTYYFYKVVSIRTRTL